MADIACPACGGMNASTQRFCGECGTSLERTCPNCGAANPVRFAFCGTCGEALDTETVRVVPGTEERRWATVLFADLSGFTSLSERTDPEEVRALIDRCMDAMGEIVEKFGGFVSRVSGDEMLALFGAPVAHEDDPERAVRTGLEMQRQAAEKAEEFGRLGLRVGINTGEMMFAPVGPPGAREQTVMGDAVNTAKRLESAAPLGGVLVGQDTHRATRAAIRYQETEPVTAKGKADPVEAWLAVEPLAEAGSRPVSEAPIVGRTRELDLMRTIWNTTVADARPHLLTVTGSPGIGKTRLEREFTMDLGPDVLVLRGRSLPYGERTGYGAFAEQVKQLAGIYETDPAPTARAKLEELVDASFGEHEAAEVSAHVAVLLGLGEEGIVGDRHPLFLAARRLIEAVAARTPLLLVFEDVHWADPSLLDLIESLAGRTRDAPVLLFALARPELVDRRSSWGGGLVNATTLALDVLTVAEARSLAERLLPRVADGDVIDRLADVAGGNPLFLEELAASYNERTSDVVERLPTTVQGIIAARLDALPPTERRVLLDASVVGKVFWRGVLESMAVGDPVWEALDSLQARDLVRREPTSRIQGDEQYVFKHMLIREVAYATLPKAARRERHLKIARLLEESVGDRAAGYASLLAHHYREAGETDRAAHHLLVAADHARRVFAPAEAIALYEQALELLNPADPRRDQALLERAIARYRTGDLPLAASELDELRPRLSGRPLLTALSYRGKVAFWLSAVDDIFRFSDDLLGIAERDGDQDARVLGLANRCYATSLSGDLDESSRLGEEALRTWPPDGPDDELPFLLTIVGLVEYWRGDLDRCLELVERGYERGLQTYNVEGVLSGGANYALALGASGRYEQALTLFEDIVTKGRELELVPRWSSRAMNMFAGTLREVGDHDRARELNERAVEAARSVPFPTGAVQGEIDLLFDQIRSGDFGRAHAAWPDLMERGSSLHGFHEWLVQGRLLVARAEIDLGRGKPEEAADSALRAIEHADRYGRLKYGTGARRAMALALAALGRHDEAAGHAKRALSDAERLGHRPTLWRSAAGLSEILHAMGDDDGAKEAHERARGVIAEVADSLPPAHREVFLAHHPFPDPRASAPFQKSPDE